MTTFTLKEVTANGTAQILENGNLIQKCIVLVQIDGIVLENQSLLNVVDFEVPNSEMVGKPQPLTEAWNYIKDILAPQWVAENFANA